jgi:5'-3' exonuclease
MKELSEEGLTQDDREGIIKYGIKKEVDRKIKNDEAELIQSYKDNVNFSKEGWHFRYYKKKFNC